MVAKTPLLDEPLEATSTSAPTAVNANSPTSSPISAASSAITLVGFIDTVRAKGVSRVRTRFLGLPDAPVTSFQMKLFGGDRGLIENSRNLCARSPGWRSDSRPRTASPG